MKHVFIILLLVFSKISLFSMGIGGMINISPKINYGNFPLDSNFDMHFATGATFTLCEEFLPFIFLVETNYDVLAYNFDLNVAFDFPFYKNHNNNFRYYFALGSLFGTTIESDNAKLNLAPRFSMCFSWDKFDGFLEPFLSIAIQPSFTLDFKNSNGSFLLQFPVGVGLRIWD